MENGADERIETLARQKMQGKSYSTIREELAREGLNREEISSLLRQVDEHVLSETVKQAGREKIQTWYRAGLLISVTGLLVSIAYNAGILLNSLPSWLVYAPFFAGIMVMIYARALQRKQYDPPDKGSSPIRKRRPFK